MLAKDGGEGVVADDGTANKSADGRCVVGLWLAWGVDHKRSSPKVGFRWCLMRLGEDKADKGQGEGHAHVYPTAGKGWVIAGTYGDLEQSSRRQHGDMEYGM